MKTYHKSSSQNRKSEIGYDSFSLPDLRFPTYLSLGRGKSHSGKTARRIGPETSATVCVRKCLFHLGHCVIQPSMQRAQVHAVGFQIQRTGADTGLSGRRALMISSITSFAGSFCKENPP